MDTNQRLDALVAPLRADVVSHQTCNTHVADTDAGIHPFANDLGPLTRVLPGHANATSSNGIRFAIQAR